MIDLSYFQNQNSNVQGFFNGGTWQTWIKPRGAKLVNIICQGSGAGGGGGELRLKNLEIDFKSFLLGLLTLSLTTAR